MLWYGVSENKKAGKFARSVLLHPVQRCYKFPIPLHPSSSNLIPFISQTPYIYLTGFQDVSEFSHLRINHSTHFAERQNHINGIENFWNQAKRHLRKFNGIPKEHFELYLKECEWRFNNSEIKVQISILKQLVKHDLF